MELSFVIQDEFKHIEGCENINITQTETGEWKIIIDEVVMYETTVAPTDIQIKNE